MLELKIDQVTVEFRTRRTQEIIRALEKIELHVPAGEFVTILGPSGCGKTTLLNTIAGLQSVTAGNVWLDGERITRPGHNRAMVFQSPSLLPWRTVESNIAYGLELQGVSRQSRDELVKKYTIMVGLAGFEQSYPYELSGGMQQRVNLARALATEPELLLLDEPLAALDPLLREFMGDELEKIWQQTRQTTIFVTHQIGEAVFLGDRVVVMTSRPGQVKEEIDINLPRPRPKGIRHTPEFHRLEDRIWDILKDSVLENM